MTTEPLIGVTTYAPNSEDELKLPKQYVTAIRRAGGIPLLVPPLPTDLGAIIDLLDAVVLAGGGDIDPQCYRGVGHPEIYGVDTDRDAVEMELAKRIIDRRLPTLAICRGCQVVNVVLGGSLHPHLPDVVGETVLHRVPPRRPTPHRVTIDGRSQLSKIVAAQVVEPMSWHHQAIDRLGDGLAVVARADDQVVEAVEIADQPWLIAVQWHPELTADCDPTQQRLFQRLVALAKGEGDGRPNDLTRGEKEVRKNDGERHMVS